MSDNSNEKAPAAIHKDYTEYRDPESSDLEFPQQVKLQRQLKNRYVVRRFQAVALHARATDM